MDKTDPYCFLSGERDYFAIEKKKERSKQMVKKTEFHKMEAMEKQEYNTSAAHRGKLKIFFGYAAGSGKTYAMLQAGHEARRRGVDVILGYLEPHDRKDTMAMAIGLEIVEPCRITTGTIEQREMDLDAILNRHPTLVLVDELAHTNAGGLRHRKRYQDVKELLENGIDVYTTVNVQHLESLRDLVASITGIQVAERIPDDVFDLADQVHLVDIEPDDLLERLREGKVYPLRQAQLAQDNFFTRTNLAALREIALRRCADRMNRILPGTGSRDHILVCLSSSPSNATVIRAAARMAQAFDARFSGLYIQSVDTEEMETADAIRLEENMRLANRLGATINTVYGDDPAYQIGEFARIMQVSKIVLGRSGLKSRFPHGNALADQLADTAKNAEIFIIPDPDAPLRPEKSRQWKFKKLFSPAWNGALICAGALILAYLTSCTLVKLGFSEANILAVFLFESILAALYSRNVLASAINAMLSMIVFSYRFASPQFSLEILDQGYGLTFAASVAISMFCAQLSWKVQKESRFSARAAARNALLNETGQCLQMAESDEEIIDITLNQIQQMLNRSVVFYPNNQGSLGKPFYRQNPQIFLSAKEQAVALWTLKNNKRAGASTDTLGAAEGLYLAVRKHLHVYGVLGIDLKKAALSADENAIILSLLGQCALALENNENARNNEANALHSQKEKMRADMLRSISHDLRTPLTTICASAQMLSASDCPEEEKKLLLQTIAEDASWLKETVENLLAMTRLENGSLQLNMELMDLEEAIQEALRHVRPAEKGHPVQIVESEQALMVMAEGRLLVQLIVNLLDNAIKYTPEQTPIMVSAYQDQNFACLEVADHGPGIHPWEKDHLFEPFQTAHCGAADSYRSMGLGLSLCKTIAEVHNGQIELLDNQPGCRFRIRLPLKEVCLEREPLT